MFFIFDVLIAHVIIFLIVKTPPFYRYVTLHATGEGGTGVLLLKQKIHTSYDVRNWYD